jgi:uncharacterized protein
MRQKRIGIASSLLWLTTFAIGAVCAACLLFALAPAGDLARLLLAANGNYLRGVVFSAAIAIAMLASVAYLLRGKAPHRRRLSVALSTVVVLSALANVWQWSSGMSRHDVVFTSDGTTLRGTLMMPDAAGPHPVVVIVHGSANLGRDFYAVWGRPMVASGIAVFVYDKRGTGRSEGEIPRDNNSGDYLRQLGTDAAHAVDAVSSRSDIDVARIGLLGMSQGGWTVPIAARLRPNVRRIALLSGPVVSVGEEMTFSAIAEGANRDRFRDIAAIAAGERAIASAAPSGFAPDADLQALRCEGLWLYGDRDREVPVSASAGRLQKLMTQGKPFRSRLLPDADHLLLDRKRFPPAFHSAVMPSLIDWFKYE